jgi:hypothetical protein
MEEHVRKAVVDAIEPNEAVSLVKLLVGHSESRGRRARVRSLSV